jgi:hypothetical protein
MRLTNIINFLFISCFFIGLAMVAVTPYFSIWLLMPASILMKVFVTGLVLIVESIIAIVMFN